MIDATFIAIVLGSFFAAVFNAAFSAGGALIVLAVTSTVLPIQAVVPIHSTLLVGSGATRMLMFREHVDWRLVRPFLAGAFVGALVGTRVYFELPETMLAMAIALLMLVALWLPRIRWRPNIRHPWAIVGFVHALMSTLFAYGALLHSVIPHTDLDRRRIIGTMAGCLTGMSAFKIAGYAFFGFDYMPYLVLIAAAVGVSFVGTAIGKRAGERLSEEKFRLAYKLLITLSALRLLYAGLR